jgi:radical SAM protein with 4Fe4S-binding SPASM domain
LSVIGYGEFTHAVHERLAAERIPLDVTLEITHRCPLECQHCYNNLPMSDRDAARRELTLAEYQKLLDELAAMGTFWLLFSGGEPFARKDFLDIYTYAKQKGFLITIFTNGTIITPAIADHLAKYPPFAIEITLYGRTKQVYEEMTQQPGSYERCLHGIDLLLARGLPLKLKTVPTSINKHEVFAMQKFAEDLGMEFKFDSLINPRIDCSQSPLGVRLNPAEVVAFDYVDPARKAEYRRLLDIDLAAGPPPVSDDLYFCGGGLRSCAVDPYGQMSICVISKRTEYNVVSGGFAQGWNQALQATRTKKRTRPSKCTSCQIQSLCGMCPANGELEHDDPESPVHFLCQVAHLRAMALGAEVPAHGDCECCRTGADYPDLQDALNDLPRTGEQLSVPVRTLLPILAAASASNSSCGGRCGH